MHAEWTTARFEAADRNWPHTSRVLPWLVAALIVTIFLVPIDSVTLPVPLPFDARPDRVLLIACFLVWMLAASVTPPRYTRRSAYRFGLIEVLLVAFTAVAIASVALNLPVLERLGEASLSSRKLVLLVSYVGFYLFVVGVVRPSEVRAFVRLMIALAVIAAAGTIVEFSVGYNAFFAAADALAPPGTHVAPHAAVLLQGARPDVTGPARHGLAVAAMLAMVLPLALVGTAFATSRRDRVIYTIAALVIFAGSLATLRRSGVVLPFLASSAVLLLGGRRMRPVAVIFFALVVALPVVAPGAIRDVRAQFSGRNVELQQSTEGRTSDYPAVVPDLRAGALLGRGFGSYDASRYRFLDNQYLSMAIETGFVGLATYIAVIITAGAIALREGVRRRSTESWIALAGAGSMFAFLIANALFDALAFPHAPYTFLLIVALVGVGRRATTASG